MKLLAVSLLCLPYVSVWAGDYSVKADRFETDSNGVNVYLVEEGAVEPVDPSFKSGPGERQDEDVEDEEQPDPIESNPYDLVGISPTTLSPQGFDFSSMFPSYPLSSDLVLKPSLSFGEDTLRTRNGDFRYGAPKVWRNHYGELVRVIPQMPVGPQTLTSPIRKDIHTYFVNAEGQDVDFYPSTFPNQSDTWYSDDGNWTNPLRGSCVLKWW